LAGFETYVKIKGKWYHLYRSTDKEGQTLDWMLSRYRNKQAATRHFKKVLSNNHVVHPRVINVDKNPAFVPTHKVLQDEKLISSKFKLR
jgi:transposase, IS6 family